MTQEEEDKIYMTVRKHIHTVYQLICNDIAGSTANKTINPKDLRTVIVGGFVDGLLDVMSNEMTDEQIAMNLYDLADDFACKGVVPNLVPEFKTLTEENVKQKQKSKNKKLTSFKEEFNKDKNESPSDPEVEKKKKEDDNDKDPA